MRWSYLVSALSSPFLFNILSATSHFSSYYSLTSFPPSFLLLPSIPHTAVRIIPQESHLHHETNLITPGPLSLATLQGQSELHLLPEMSFSGPSPQGPSLLKAPIIRTDILGHDVQTIHSQSMF